MIYKIICLSSAALATEDIFDLPKANNRGGIATAVNDTFK